MKILISISIIAMILLEVPIADAQINVSDSSIAKPKHFSENVFGVLGFSVTVFFWRAILELLFQHV